MLGGVALPHVAEEVRGEGALGVEALGHGQDFDAREVLDLFGDVGEGGELHVLPDDERDGATLADVPDDLLATDLAGKPQTPSELVDERVDGEDGVVPRAGLAQLFAVDDDGVGRAVIGEHHAITVEDAPAQSGVLHEAQTLARLDRAVTPRFEHLHLPETPAESQNPHREEGGQDPERPDAHAGLLRFFNVHGSASPLAEV